MAKKLVYQMWPIAWRTLKEMTNHLKRLKDMDIDYIWVSPLYPSPRLDHGYDIMDYISIDQRFGTMKDFDKFVRKAHKLGMGVLMDLVLNHTSIGHPWFIDHPDRYIWSENKRTGWENLFNGSSSWKFDSNRQLFFLHLFSETQADLNWFPDGRINQDLITDFKSIIRFWLHRHDIDGFRLDCPQAINKDLNRDTLKFENLLRGEKAAEVINALFDDKNAPYTNKGEPPFLIMECFDPTFGDIIDYYRDRTPVDYFLNPLLKSSIKDGTEVFRDNLNKSVKNSHFMLDLESHDSPRFTSVSELNQDLIFSYLFGSKANGVCLYQGQELGLKNPDKNELSDAKIINLDSMSAMKLYVGKKMSDIRLYSRANNRVPLPLWQYSIQKKDPTSTFSLIKYWIASWKYW